MDYDPNGGETRGGGSLSPPSLSGMLADVQFVKALSLDDYAASKGGFVMLCGHFSDAWRW